MYTEQSTLQAHVSIRKGTFNALSLYICSKIRKMAEQSKIILLRVREVEQPIQQSELLCKYGQAFMDTQ